MAYARITVDEAILPSKRPALGHDIFAGVRAGQVGGLAFALLSMVLGSVFLQKNILFPLQVIGSASIGEHSSSGLALALAGLLVHQFGPSLVWGVVFGGVVWAFRPRGGVALLFSGLLVGVVAQVVDVYLVLPMLSGSLAGKLPVFVPLQHHNLWTVQIPAPLSWLAHLVYGLVLSVYPWRFDPLARTFD